MYTVSKGPSKLVAKTRRHGIPQSYEKYEIMRDLNRKSECDSIAEISVPKPVFQTSKKAASQYLKTQQQLQQTESEVLSPQHEELIRYIHDSWNMVVAQNPYDVPGSPDSTTGSTSSLSSTTSSSSSITSVYYNDPPSPYLVDFKPFDLESWWGRRLFNNITKSL